jgi:transcription elongation GreA/GreB family factor/Tfp pilus assembly protein PilF
MRYRYMMPGNEDEFEEFCLRFYRQLLKRDTLTRYGKRGQRQHGIDLIDQLKKNPVYAIQCKHHEPHKALEAGEISAEVKKAEAAPHCPDHYVVATTAQRSTLSHDEMIKLNSRPSNDRRFSVEIHFWEDICARLDEFEPAIAEFILSGRLTEEAEARLAYLGLTKDCLLPPEADSSVDSSYPDITRLLDERKVEAARHEFNKLPNPKDNSLTKEQRYGILRIRGKLAIEHQEYEDAAKSFLEAYEVWPELEQAKLNRILALGLLGERSEAYAEAEKLVAEGGKSKALVNLLLRYTSTVNEIDHHASLIEQFSDDAEVNTTLAQQFLALGELDKAQIAAERALIIEHDSAHAHLAAAMIAHHSAMEGQVANRKQKLTLAKGHYTKALELAERDKYTSILPEGYSNRARVHGYFGDVQKASEDYRRAVSVAYTPALYAPDAVNFFLSIDDFKSARELLSYLADNQETEFLHNVVAYGDCTTDDDRRNVICKMLQVAERHGQRSVEARFFCVHWSVELNDLELAKTCISEEFITQRPFQGSILQACLAMAANDEKLARQQAEQTLQHDPSTGTRQEFAVLAKLFVHLGDDDRALSLWDQARLPGLLDEPCKRLLECAQRLRRDDVLIRICEELRINDTQDDQVRKLEVQVLSHYLPARAYELAEEFKKYDEPYFTAARNYIALRLNVLDEIETNLEKLPKAGRIDASESYLVVIPLLKAKCYDDAVNFSYHQLRQNFDSERAHVEYMQLILQYGSSSSICKAAEKVGNNSAIHLENTLTHERRWLIVEEDHPQISLNEMPAASPIVQTFFNHAVDDIVELPNPGIQKNEERIIEIQSKYVRRFQDCTNFFQVRFPEGNAIQKVNVASDGEFDPALIFQTLKDRREYVSKCFDFYIHNLCSIHLLASRIGTNELNTIKGLISNDAWVFRCSRVDPQNFDKLVLEGTKSNKIALDVTAIISISMLNAWSLLDPSKEYLTSLSTVDLIRSWLEELSEDRNQTSAYSYMTDDGRFVMSEVTEDELKSRREEIEQILARISEFCTVNTSPGIAELDPEKRRLYIDAFGYPTLEVVKIAKDENAVLWTDDFFVAYWALSEFQLTRIWTQLAIKLFSTCNSSSVDGYHRMTAKLVAWRYVDTMWNADTLLAAGRFCRWDCDLEPMKDCINLLAHARTPLDDRALICMEFLHGLRHSNCSQQLHPLIVRRVLDALGDVEAIKWILHNIWRLFGQDISSQKFMREELTAWLRHNR